MRGAWRDLNCLCRGFMACLDLDSQGCVFTMFCGYMLDFTARMGEAAWKSLCVSPQHFSIQRCLNISLELDSLSHPQTM